MIYAYTCSVYIHNSLIHDILGLFSLDKCAQTELAHTIQAAQYMYIPIHITTHIRMYIYTYIANIYIYAQ